MYAVKGVQVRQLVRWNRNYHSGLGVFGHRPAQVDATEVSQEVLERRFQNCRAQQLVQAYRAHGHKLASVDNVDYRREVKAVRELDVNRYGLKPQDYVDTGLLYGSSGKEPTQKLVDKLNQIYCGNIAYEFSHLETEVEREWFAQKVEDSTITVDNSRKIELATEMLETQALNKFFATKFPAIKRYTAEGAESILAIFSTLNRLASAERISNVVIGMAHRGKLNVLTGPLGYPHVKLFHKFSGNPEFPPEANSTCDIALHFSTSSDIKINDTTVRVSLCHNPSHLEIVNPVSMGKARSKQLKHLEGDYSRDKSSKFGDKVINIQVHGDAAFAGQGVNQESLMLSKAPHFDVGGSIHVVVNNQVGFTLPGKRNRSTPYVTDVAKMVAAPVIHVNADHPELVVRAITMAFEYQRRFRRDVFIDFNCFRKKGHNELDDPTLTSPLLYKHIESRKSIPDLYAEQLVSSGILSEDDVTRIVDDHVKYLQSQFEAVGAYQPEADYFKQQWGAMRRAPAAVETWDTGVGAEALKLVARKSVEVPSDFNIHPHLLRTHVNPRLKRISEGKDLDWATAEAMAIGSLLLEGRHVRLSGEDVGRGTFSHRHAMLVDRETEAMHIPLNHLRDDQKGFFEVANTILSEEAVLAFEYGMAYDSPDNLIIWEAQFGDFFNGAQIVFDTYIGSGEAKWVRSNGLVVLLPHGMDGTASEHSSCRLERFLQLTDSSETRPDSEDVCLHVVYPTTPAQYFHLLRRQMVRNYRKPLVVVAPKTLLRMSEAASPAADLLPGTHFRPVLGDPIAQPHKVRRVILVSGKHYYELNRERVRAHVEDVAIIRLESLAPFPLQALQHELDKYTNARTFIWSQEEHRNQGAWSFVKLRFDNLLGRKLIYSGRSELAAPAVGASRLHKQEVEHILKDPLYNIK